MAKFWSIVFLAHFFPQSGHAACTQNQNRINATAGSKCIPIYPAYTTMGTSVFNAQGAGSTITANAAVTLTNTLNGANGRGATATNGGSIIFNELVTITTGCNPPLK